ncbi:hypothetical protein SLS63_008453 [Diaporthe eres]|uniref:Heterokaryon incompatibility domain-containing protein n=1 Tax=Diaporthe eres TaxID=83184 RepID=A0ABR1P2I3_DIAER
MASYRYKPLPKIPGEKSIRLATIYPGVGDDDVLVDLHIESFTMHSPPRYEALSYVWGSTEPPELVWVGGPGRATLQVTTNLRTALQHLRYPDQERVMWVDALCINQSDDVEKGAEVARMGELFACAAHVVVWLGPEADGSDMAMERLEYIGSQVDVDWGGMHRITPAARLEPVDGSIADPNSNLPMDAEQSAAVVSLLNRGWFDRLWIRQEILVAEDKAFVCCGPHQMPWSVFRKALRLFYSRRSEPYNVVYLLQKRMKPLVGSLPDHIGFGMIEGTAKLEWSRRFMDLRSGELFHEDPRLENLGVDLDEFRARLAEDPEAMLILPPEVLRKRIADLQYIDLI